MSWPPLLSTYLLFIPTCKLNCFLPAIELTTFHGKFNYDSSDLFGPSFPCVPWKKITTSMIPMFWMLLPKPTLLQAKEKGGYEGDKWTAKVVSSSKAMRKIDWPITSFWFIYQHANWIASYLQLNLLLFMVSSIMIQVISLVHPFPVSHERKSLPQWFLCFECFYQSQHCFKPKRRGDMKEISGQQRWSAHQKPWEKLIDPLLASGL